MADEVKKRPWFLITRIQGIIVTVAGVAMLFNKTTSPYAGQVIAAGLGMVAGGVNANVTRKLFNKPK